MKRLILIAGLLLFASCVVDTVQDAYARFDFSDGVKMVWERTLEIWSDGDLISSSRHEITMEHVGYRYLRGYYCYVFRVTETNATGAVFEYISNTDTGMVLVDIEGSVILPVIFRNDSNIPAEVRETIHRLISSPFFTQLERPQLVLSYPLEFDKKWTVFDYPWHRERQIVGTEDVTVPAGNFYAWKMEARDSHDESFVIRDYITGEAWVKKVIETKIYSPPSQEWTVVDTYVLKSISWEDE